MKTVKKKEEDMKRSNHPVALEIYAVFNTDARLALSSEIVTKIINAMIKDAQEEGFGFDIRDFDIGIEYSVVVYDRENKGVIEAEKRWSRNGEEWEHKNITEKVRERLGV